MGNKKIAAVDIGTNSFHLIVVELKEDGNFSIVDREREVIRLSEGSKGDIKKICSSAEYRAIETLKRFKNIADSHNASLRAVATSAVRESLNKIEFINRVFEAADVKIEVISGYEEARLIYLGILKAVPCYHKKTLCIDIGGGSTEFLLGINGSTIFANSLKLGAVRLTERFFPDYIVTDERIKECRNWVKGELIPIQRDLLKNGFDIVVGSSGTIQAAASMISSLKKTEEEKIPLFNNYKFSLKELKNVSNLILKKSTKEERLKIKGLDQKRADIIPAGIVLLATIFEVLEIKKITVSDYALREGIIIDTIQKTGFADSPKLYDIRLNSVNQLAESCRFDKKHCIYVAELALSLFSQLSSIHQLDKNCGEYLESAAKLHDIGFHISHSQHHKHSQYFIRNSELLGYNNTEIYIIANVARYHRKSHPQNKHTDFAILSEDNQQIVKKLSGILRIADSLDRSHKQNIKNISCNVNDERVVIKAEYEGDYPDVEVWSLERKKLLFEEVFGKTVELELIKNPILLN
ncbi:MAG: Ppx/GppA family phosphatase [Melioribacteraceae bacterium]|nr:Ppx/GppA family phosphatase [Melioribacteraceae bacterium]